MYFTDLAEEVEPQLVGPKQAARLVVLEQEHNNLRAALRWAVEQNEAALGFRLCIALQVFWEIGGYRSEARHWVQALLATPGQASTFLHARALAMAGDLARDQGDATHAIALLEEALALYRQLADSAGIVNIRGRLAYAFLITGDSSQAIPLFEECLMWARDTGDRRLTALHLEYLGQAAYEQGDYAKAEPLLAESLALFRELGDTRNVAWALSQAGGVAAFQRDFERAVSLFEESGMLYFQRS
jgi:tetratricopeptide (TPR) repeat protein